METLVSTSGGLRWSVEDPNGGAVFTADQLINSDPGVRTLPLTGTYKITVSDKTNTVATYQFQLIEQ